ncbi:MAG: hypothetical protein K0R57_1343 [Paenibacillaceae bacterium]|jgi:hypothetical protein|nr:hypothetical protein [Paenibacillaceae bacterium]
MSDGKMPFFPSTGKMEDIQQPKRRVMMTVKRQKGA